MKKTLITLTVAATLTGLSAFAQGNFIFSSGGGFVWNDTVSPPVKGGAFNVGFLWSPSLTATSKVFQATGYSLIPTNNVLGSSVQGPTTGPAGAPGTAWAALTSDPNFQFGMDFGTGLMAVGTLTGTGGITYNAASPFTVTGTSTGGGSVLALFVAWSNLYATPQAAAAAGSPVGWSNPFAYAYTATGVAPTGMGAQAAGEGVDAHFGVALVPEPTTFALAGLGAAALLIFRRRK